MSRSASVTQLTPRIAANWDPLLAQANSTGGAFGHRQFKIELRQQARDDNCGHHTIHEFA
jgi:hypothetical protein